MFKTNELFFDAKLIDNGDKKSVTYRTGMAVYEEGFIDGMFVAYGWNGAGYVPQVATIPEVPRLNHKAFAEPSAFSLVIDGQLLHSHWEWVGYEQKEEDRGLLVTVSLKNMVRPISVKIKTFLDGTPILSRWLEITNVSDTNHAAISNMAVLSGGLQITKRHRNHLRPSSKVYRVGHLDAHSWGFEGSFKWHTLTNGGYYFGGRFLRGRHRHPMFVLENNATGECFIGQLGYSGGYRFDFDLNDNPYDACLSLKAGPDGYAPIRVLDPNDTTITPKIHIGMMFGGLDECVNAMNAHIRRSVMTYPYPVKSPLRGGIGPEMDMSQPGVLAQIDSAAMFGEEMFEIDAAWYSDDGKENDWLYNNGDWFPEKCRYEMGFDGIREYCHKKGLKFGLWMEPERLGRDSQAFKDHPEFCTVGYDDRIRGGINGGGGIVDISKPEAAKWVEKQIIKLIETYKLDYLRLDFNVGNEQTRAYTKRGEFLENSDYRYYENWYGIYRRLRERFPDVVFENCASGGGRTDLGMMATMSHTQLSDWFWAPRSFAIINGLSMCLPPENLDHLVGGCGAHTLAELDFNLRLLVFSRPSIAMMTERRYVVNPIHIGRIKHVVDIFKNIVRPMHDTGSRVYHHTPELDINEPKGTGVLEYVSNDGSIGILGIFQLSDPVEKEIKVCFKGLDISKNFRLRMDNLGSECIISGFELVNSGIIVRLATALTSELIIAQAI